VTIGLLSVLLGSAAGFWLLSFAIVSGAAPTFMVRRLLNTISHHYEDDFREWLRLNGPKNPFRIVK
jgi:uncharacterized membrane protein YdjX (TVP38/TMEM64 family)